METTEYIVSGRLSGQRICVVKASSAAESIKIARKGPATAWRILELNVSPDLTARRLHGKSTPVKNHLKSEIEAVLPDYVE